MSLLLTLATYWLAPPCFSAPLSNLAQQHYKEGKIDNALQCCQKIIKINPDEPGAHYLLANCYYLKGNKIAALEQYQIAFELDPFGKAGQNARQALLGMGVPLEDPDNTNQELPPADSSGSIKKAVTKIRDQIQESRLNSQTTGNRYAEQTRRAGEIRINRLRQAADDIVSDILPRNRRASAAQEAEVAHWRSVYFAEQQRARNDAYIQAQRHRSWAAKREHALEECGESLCLLLAEQPQAGKHKLLASGTNVYVRNYGSGELEALRAQALARNSQASNNIKFGGKNFSANKNRTLQQKQMNDSRLATAGRFNRTAMPASELTYLDKRVSKVSGIVLRPSNLKPARSVPLQPQTKTPTPPFTTTSGAGQPAT